MGQTSSTGRSQSSYVVEIAPAPTTTANGRDKTDNGQSVISAASWSPVSQRCNGAHDDAADEGTPTRMWSTKKGYTPLPVNTCTAPVPWRIIVNPTSDEHMDHTSFIGHHQRTLMQQHNIPSTPHQDELANRVRQALQKKLDTVPSPATSSPCSSTRSECSASTSATGAAPPPIIIDKLPRYTSAEPAGFSGEQYKEKLMAVVNSLYGHSKIIDVNEAKSLVISLQLYDTTVEPHTGGSANDKNNNELLMKTLTAISNLAAFSGNQDLLREHGAISELHRLLVSCTAAGGHAGMTVAQRIMLIQAVGNMAVNVNNHKLLQSCVGPLCTRLRHSQSSEMERIVCAQSLTNLSVHIDTTHMHHYTTIVTTLYARLWTDNKCNMAVLKLLVNMSAEQVLCTWLVGAEPEEVLVRASTFLANLCSTIDAACIDWSFVQHEMKTEVRVAYSGSVLYAIRGAVGAVEFARRCKLLKYHPNEEISQRCQRILHSCTDYIEAVEQRQLEAATTTTVKAVDGGGSVNTPTETSDDAADESMASSSAHESLVNF